MIKNRHLALAVCALALGMNTPVMAEKMATPNTGHVLEDHNKEIRADHYEGKTFETEKEAMIAFFENMRNIARILEKDDELEFLDMENIHEISYTLETALEKLKTSGKLPEQNHKKMSASLEAVHIASEEQEEETIRREFDNLNRQYLLLNRDAS